ncbi:Breast cancer metastasis-suppressor 1-like protein-A [Halotydeus destructor]|nr:Breast cancer metastasis-suppressor 1-like protein-A [Halotydeus destructor]
MNLSQEKEEMEVDEANESDKIVASSNEDTDSDTGESASDAEDIDEDECIRRKTEISGDMADLEKQFSVIKEQLYYERLSHVEQKLNEVKAEVCPDYLTPLEELRDNMRVRLEVAGILRDLRIANVKCQYDAEMVAAKQSFEGDCRILKEQLKQDVEDKLRRLEEDRNSVDSEFWNDTHMKKKRRFSTNFIDVGPLGKDQLCLPDRRRKPVSVSGPYIVYMLREQDIMEDYHLIRKASKSQGSCYYF